ncbi:MAG: energy transducer TonB [Bacteroidaceae bacterium]|nr:energy transducer TonB [Bacteroidaceae bacterium]
MGTMPNWTPGKQKGEPVRVRFTLPVSFRLSGGSTDKAQEPAKVAQTENASSGDEIFQVVENMPEYPGGMSELMKYLQKEIKYPKEAQEQGKQGRVIVEFVVEKNGSITEAKVMKPVDPLLDAEALRVVSAMPNWNPGKQRGKEVRTRFTLPVTFRLSN